MTMPEDDIDYKTKNRQKAHKTQKTSFPKE